MTQDKASWQIVKEHGVNHIRWRQPEPLNSDDFYVLMAAALRLRDTLVSEVRPEEGQSWLSAEWSKNRHAIQDVRDKEIDAAKNKCASPWQRLLEKLHSVGTTFQ